MVKAAQEKAAQRDAGRRRAKADEGAVRVPYVPQIVKDEIAKQVAEQVKPDVVADVVKEAKTEKWGVPGALADWLTRTRISGSVTLREEDVTVSARTTCRTSTSITTPSTRPAESRRRARTPSRTSTWTTSAFAAERGSRSIRTSPIRSRRACASSTGNTSDLVSETQTFDGTAPYAFGLDEAYIRLDERNAQKFPWLSVVGGRFSTPIRRPPI